MKRILLAIFLCYGSTVYSQVKPTVSESEIKQHLGVYRSKIDSLDAQLISIIGQRERIVREIGIYKAENNIPALQKDRFKQVLERSIEAGKKEGLSPVCVEEIMTAIHKESLRIEQSDIDKKKL